MNWFVGSYVAEQKFLTGKTEKVKLRDISVMKLMLCAEFVWFRSWDQIFLMNFSDISRNRPEIAQHITEV